MIMHGNMGINESQNTQRISDFGCIAAMLTAGFDIQSTERKGTRIYFIFDNSDELKTAVADYWSRKLALPLLDYFENTKRLKSRIYSE